MKSRLTLLLPAAVVALFFASCAADVAAEKPRPVVELLSVKIGDLNVSGIPEPVFDKVWDDQDYQVASADFGTFVVKRAAEIEDVKITATATPGARVRWGIASSGNRPDSFEDIRVNATFSTTNFLYFKVTAEDGVTTNYYRFYPVDASPVKELATVNIKGRQLIERTVGTGGSAVKFKIPLPATTLEALVGYTDENNVDVDGLIKNDRYYGRIDITRPETSNARVEAEPQDKNARVRFAIAPSLDEADKVGEFVDTIKEIVVDENEREATRAVGTVNFSDGNILIVEVAAENEDTNYYAFVITAGRMATISSLKLDGVLVTNIGTEHDVWSTVTPGNYSSADQGADGFAIAIELEDPQATYQYALIPDVLATPPATFGADPKILFGHKQALAVRVRSIRGAAADTRYYKVEIDLLAANVKRQPKSDYYYYYDANTLIDPGVSDINWYDYIKLEVDPNHPNFTDPVHGSAAVRALSIELDRPDTGFTYQWYEANSWYGGYGFDADGRILYYKTTADGKQETDPTKEAGFSSEVGYVYPGYENMTITEYPKADNVKDPFHQGHFDEKRNVSLHNGGNDFYNLPIPGRPIPAAEGGTAATYTPKVNFRPFIAGFSNESHYYWVVATDPNGLKVTSERATIVSERNPEKSHFIVDLYAYLDTSGNTPGLQANPRNPTPFKAGNHGDKYAIPITFPAGFDIMDYSVVTCQALFFLSDGRPWIQNWTQGDFGFELDGVNVVLWYNLTADNATRGLQASGNDPSGSGLSILPSHLVVKPAGTKPLRDLPPFIDAKDVLGRDIPKLDGNAQGWFTPYIHISEIRFEGPSRK